MVLNILFGILGVFAIIFLEGLLGAFLGLRIFFVVYVFLFKKIGWRSLLLLSIPILLVFDVAYVFPFGTNILMAGLSLGFLMILGKFFSLDSVLTSFFLFFLTFLLYYILFSVLPSFLVSGEFGYIGVGGFGAMIVKSLVSSGLVVLLEYGASSLRNRGNSSQIRLK